MPNQTATVPERSADYWDGYNASYKAALADACEVFNRVPADYVPTPDPLDMRAILTEKPRDEGKGESL